MTLPSVGFLTFSGGLRPLAYVVIYLLCVFAFCEYILYYVVLLQCSWPQQLQSSDYLGAGVAGALKLAIVADTHLLGPRRGHWFDKLRREWQMYRSFQTMMSIYNPKAVFFLGKLGDPSKKISDLFDEGLWTTEDEFNDDVARFRSMFGTPSTTNIYVVAGNHDIGFHYSATPRLNRRFVNAFKAPPVHYAIIDGNVFVLVNSMAMEGDSCFLCRVASKRLRRISLAIQCANPGKSTSEQGTMTAPDSALTLKTDCAELPQLPANTRPILMQHFPMYRESDATCDGIDAAPIDERSRPFRQTWECLSKNATEQLLGMLHPRVIFGGHTHHGCLVVHPPDVQEWSVPSFSWRNRDNPSFLLVTVTPTSHAVSKCFLPQESTVIRIYVVALFAFAAWFACFKCRHFWFSVHQKYR